MNGSAESDVLGPRIRVMQIITLMLIMGAGVFIVLAVFLQLQNPNPPPDVPVVTYVGFAFGAMQLIALLIVPAQFEKSGRRQLGRPAGDGMDADERVGRLCGIRQTSLIIGNALLEGGAFFFVIAYLAEGQALALLTAVLFVCLLIARFPTRGRLDQWIRRQEELIAQQQA
jgi:hypothetical protein